MSIVLPGDIKHYAEEHQVAEATNRDSMVNRSANSTIALTMTQFKKFSLSSRGERQRYQYIGYRLSL